METGEEKGKPRKCRSPQVEYIKYRRKERMVHQMLPTGQDVA